MGKLQRKKAPDSKRRKSRDANDDNSDQSSKKIQGLVKAGEASAAVLKNPAPKPMVVPLKSVAAKRKTEPGRVRTFIDKSVQFLREVRVELRKVAWPSRKQTIGSTLVVLILVMIISFFLGAVDVGLAGIIRFVLQ